MTDNTETGPREEQAPGKMLMELGPVAVFVLTYFFGDRIIAMLGIEGVLAKPIFLATAVLMVATPVAIGAAWLKYGSVPVMPLVTLIVVSVFGALTLYLQDDLFIKLKPTIVNCLFGAVLVTAWYLGKPWLKIVLGPAFQLDAEGWRKLTLRWGLFFFFLAVVNEIVWRTTSESFWVGFKLWGMTGLSFLFILSQMPMIQRHSTEQN